jgi:hypothetical protein
VSRETCPTSPGDGTGQINGIPNPQDPFAPNGGHFVAPALIGDRAWRLDIFVGRRGSLTPYNGLHFHVAHPARGAPGGSMLKFKDNGV